MSEQPSPTPAEVCAAFMERDQAARALGIRLLEAEAGRAVVTLTVRSDMVNGVDVCHGGVIFTLADAAMALAINSHNERALALHGEIDWLSPVPVGATLTATATHVVRRGRSAVNDVMVVDETGTLVATFRGRTLAVGGAIL